MSEQKTITPIPVMPETFYYATAYVPYQYMKEILEPEQGLQWGSVFPELVDSITKSI